MLKRLHLRNFRRHIDTEIVFDDTDHLIAISGRNGVGKSTIVEAITVAFYGEGRTTASGKRATVDSLVRRGADLEGMEVTCEFVVDGIDYRVVRRRKNRSSTAVLYANDFPIVESSQAVTAEISRILGMDAAGFRLAVIAEQKELDGLASLRPAERAKMLSRLLRLDALAVARQTARETHNTERKVVDAIGTVADIASLDAQVAAAQSAADQAAAALADAEATLAKIDRDIADNADVEVRYHEANTRFVAASSHLDAVLAERDRTKSALDSITIPAAPAATRELADVLRDQNELATQIAEAEAARKRRETQRVIEADHTAVVDELRQITDTIAEHGTSTEIRGRCLADTAELTAVEADLTRLQSEHRDAERARSEAAATAAELRRRLDGFNTLTGTCDRCGQDVDEDHLATEVAELQARIDELTATADAAGAAAADAAAAASQCERALDEIRARLQAGQALADRVAALEVRVPELERRRDTYEAQIAQMLVADVEDIESLYERRTRLAIEEADATAAADTHRRIAEAHARRERLAAELVDVDKRVEEAASARDSAQVPADLAEAYQQHRTRLAERAAEAELVASCRTEVAVCAEQVRSAEAARDGAAELERKRAERSRKAMVAAEAARLIDAVHADLSQQMRPDLEGAVSEIISQMSNGRFPSVRISDDYDVTVHDDGDWRPLSELSGGEVDLVALSVRLGLASVVAERAGTGGCGFLVLDECFGSQDRDRRQSIMEALHHLRTRYGQILIISHVGGIEELADKVVEISTTEDRSETVIDIQ